MNGKQYCISEYGESKRTKSTQRVTRIFLNAYIRYLYPEISAEETDTYSLKYLTETEDHFSVLRDYLIFLNKSGLAPNTINSRITYVIHWLKWNRVYLTTAEYDMIRRNLPAPVTVHEDKRITPDHIRSIVFHSDTLLKAFVLMVSSSGARVNEVLNLKFSDLREGKPRSFHIPRERMKAGKPHTYFYSDEAHMALEEWLKIRSAAVRHAESRTVRCLHREWTCRSDRIFPLTYEAVRQKFCRSMRNAGLFGIDTQSGRSEISFHSLRKWCESTMKLYMPINVANELIGHDEGLSRHYRRYTEETLREYYLLVEPHLRILSSSDCSLLREESSGRKMFPDSTIITVLLDSYASRIAEMERELETLRSLVTERYGTRNIRAGWKTDYDEHPIQ